MRSANELGVFWTQKQTPQGYLGFTYSFPEPPSSPESTRHGYYNFDFDFTLKQGLSQGTFISFNVTFKNSTSQLPPNHVGGDQGGYLGVQTLDDGTSIAIFSLWWALAAEGGPGATTTKALEAWYNDDKPFDPRIADMNSTDVDRPVAGGPYWKCTLPITLKTNKHYRIRIWELSEASKPDDPEWWGAWLIDVDTKTEQMIGKIQMPGSWDWMNQSPGGFIEHFAAMPNGCDSIPESHISFANAVGNAGTAAMQTAISGYGKCLDSMQPRMDVSTSDHGWEVKIGPVPTSNET